MRVPINILQKYLKNMHVYVLLSIIGLNKSVLGQRRKRGENRPKNAGNKRIPIPTSLHLQHLTHLATFWTCG